MNCVNVRVILLAGGTGSRFGSAIPKQFVKIDEVPLIIYTLRRLQIEIVTDITIVCVKEWIDYLKGLIRQYDIDKVVQIVEGGATGFESICNGIKAVEVDINDNDIIVIHDSVRPLLPVPVLVDAVEKAITYGNGCATLQSIEGLVLKENEICGVEPVDRYRVMRIQTPQAFRYDFLKNLLQKANDEHKHDFPYTDGLCVYYHEPIYFSKSFTANTKITTKPDIAFMKAMMQFTDEELMGDNI